MDVTRTAHYIRQAAIGLQHAHETAGLVHRDIKPGNLLLDRTGTVKILDMGLARFFHDDSDNLTRKHDENVLGTADYLAPEQALDSHAVDIRADIYGLGATFYYILVGTTPFNEGSVAQKLIWHQTRQPKPVRSVRPEVPQPLAAVLEKMMAKDPDHRFQVPGEIVEALAPWTQTAIPPPPEDEMPRLCPAASGMAVAEVPAAGEAAAPKTADKAAAARAARQPAAAPRPAAPVAAGSPRQAPDAGPLAPEPRKSAPAQPAPKPAAEPEEENHTPSWEQITSDTEDLTARADTDPFSDSLKKLRAQRRRAARPAVSWPAWDRRTLALVLAASLLGLLLLGGALGWLFSRGRTRAAAAAAGPIVLLVTRHAPPGQAKTYPTVQQAVETPSQATPSTSWTRNGKRGFNYGTATWG
jgi:hypothetical protein